MIRLRRLQFFLRAAEFLLQPVALPFHSLQLLLELADLAGAQDVEFRAAALQFLQVSGFLRLELLCDAAALRFGLGSLDGDLLVLLPDFRQPRLQLFAELDRVLRLRLGLLLRQVQGMTITVQLRSILVQDRLARVELIELRVELLLLALDPLRQRRELADRLLAGGLPHGLAAVDLLPKSGKPFRLKLDLLRALS